MTRHLEPQGGVGLQQVPHLGQGRGARRLDGGLVSVEIDAVEIHHARRLQGRRHVGRLDGPAGGQPVFADAAVGDHLDIEVAARIHIDLEVEVGRRRAVVLFGDGGLAGGKHLHVRSQSGRQTLQVDLDLAARRGRHVEPILVIAVHDAALDRRPELQRRGMQDIVIGLVGVVRLLGDGREFVGAAGAVGLDLDIDHLARIHAQRLLNIGARRAVVGVVRGGAIGVVELDGRPQRRGLVRQPDDHDVAQLAGILEPVEVGVGVGGLDGARDRRADAGRGGLVDGRAGPQRNRRRSRAGP